MRFVSLFASFLLATGLANAANPTNAELKQQVMEAERAFAKTMKDRDFAAFTRYVSDEAVFFGGGQAITGKEAVAKAWKGLYEKPEAPFSWDPDTVEVLASGTLAISSGPIYGPDGVSRSRFNSIWRQDAPGVWHVIFDKGTPVCNCKPQQ